MSQDSPGDLRHPFSQRFRGYLPVVVDVETGGFHAATDALLEIAAVTLQMDGDGLLSVSQTYFAAVEPFEGANIEQAALDFTGIDPGSALRGAVKECDALGQIFSPVRAALKEMGCNRAVMVGHNAHFNLGFVNAAVNRCKIKRNPFHPFTCFDTASLAGLAYGHTVLARACQLAGIQFSNREAHSAAYDAEKTAELFCAIVNRWQTLGGWPGGSENDMGDVIVDKN